jgi:GTPase SAR1 family protein
LEPLYFLLLKEDKGDHSHEDEESKVKYRVVTNVSNVIIFEVLLGGPRSGKSSLAEKFCRGKFEDEHEMAGPT